MDSFSEVEQEIIVLNAVCKMVDSMVNYSMFADEWAPHYSNIVFRTAEHANLFNILLVDFLSLPQSREKDKTPFGLPRKPQDSVPSDGTYLFYLKSISENPRLSSSSKGLKSAVTSFSKWLDGETVIEKVWFPSMDLELDMRVTRIGAIKMTGDISKHNFTRLSVVAVKFQKLLAKHDQKKTLDQCYVALSEFQEWFHDHAFIYQSSHISEMLNTLRWEIHDYLYQEYQRSFSKTFDDRLNLPGYRFKAPDGVKSSFALTLHWDLMNLVRRKPNIPRFAVSDSFKTELS